MLEGLEFGLVAQIVSFVVSIVGVPLAVTKLRGMGLSRRAQLTDAASLLVKRLEQRAHPLEIQLSFYAVFARRLAVEEITALLNMRNPLDMTENRLAYSESIEFSEGEFCWRGIYRYQAVRDHAIKIYNFLYFILAMPFFVVLFSNFSEWPHWIAAFFLLPAFMAVWRGVGFSQAIEFMKEVDGSYDLEDSFSKTNH